MVEESGLLVLVRHGQSTDNALNLFSGWRDPPLTAQGVEEARLAGAAIRDCGFRFDAAFTSLLGRARTTLELILGTIGQPDLPVTADAALNERDYGELAGLNKEEARAVWGARQVHLWRKSYEAVPPGGESLAMTEARALPYLRTVVEPSVRRGERILVVAHGNSLRVLVRGLDALSPDAVEGLHIATSQIIAYRIGPDGTTLGRHAMRAA